MNKNWWIQQQEKRYLEQEWGNINDPNIEHPDHKCLLDFVKEKDRVLELGCNSGAILNHLKEKYQCNVHGIDLPSLSLKANKSFISAWDLNQGIPSWAYHKERFDLVFAFSFMEHLYNDWQILTDVNYVLKDKGLFIVSIPGKSDIVEQHIRFYPEPEFERLMRVAGFVVIEKRKHPAYLHEQHRIYVLRKE